MAAFVSLLLLDESLGTVAVAAGAVVVVLEESLAGVVVVGVVGAFVAESVGVPPGVVASVVGFGGGALSASLALLHPVTAREQRIRRPGTTRLNEGKA